MGISKCIKDLKDEREYVRVVAAETLGMKSDSIFAPEAVEPLTASLLKDECDDVRWVSAISLGRIGSSRAVLPLIKALYDRCEQVRLRAAAALGSIADSRAVPALILLLTDQSAEVRVSAAWALGSIGDPRAIEPMKEIVADVNNDTKLREETVRAMGEIGKPAVMPLITMLNAQDRNIRRVAVIALKSIDSPAGKVLSKLRDSSIIETLIELLNDANYETQCSAAWALGQIKGRTFFFDNTSPQKWQKWWDKVKER